MTLCYNFYLNLTDLEVIFKLVDVMHNSERGSFLFTN